MTPPESESSATTTKANRQFRKHAAAPVVVLLAALVGGPVALASKASGTSHPSAVPAADLPLPVIDSPITFKLSDQPGSWFDTGLTALEGVLHTRSLAATVAGSPTKVVFSVSQSMTDATHTVSSVVWPVGAEGFPYTQQGSFSGEESVEITKAGLYAFQCRVHPYMLGAVVADDPTTVGADLGKELNWIDGTVMPSAADEIMRIVRSFFLVTNPDNWQVYAADKPTTWDPAYPAAPVLTHDADGQEVLIPNLDAHFQERFNEPETLMPPVKPTQPGVGEAWVDTQFEQSAGKSKPGSMTAFDTETWDLTKKWFLPSVNLNNPHNMWSDRDQKLLYQTHWFSNKLSTVDKDTGAVLRTIEVGPSPSHVVTRSNNDNLIIPNNGGNRFVEIAPGGTQIVKSYLTQAPGKNPAFPHAHWVSYDGKHVVTPNSNETTAAIFDLDVPSLIKPESGKFPVATSMTNDGKRAYVANLLDHTISCISVAEAACPTPSGGKESINHINLRQNYDKISGKVTGPFALSPIQLPISPDDKYMLVVGTFTSNVLVIDIANHKIVKSLACGPGCHGINFGAKKGGGYYGYVSIKFANKLMVVDGDPNGDGDFSDAKVAGEMITNAGSKTKTDDQTVGLAGQGGQGVYALPNPYNGWVQKLPAVWADQLTCKQREPLSAPLC